MAFLFFYLPRISKPINMLHHTLANTPTYQQCGNWAFLQAYGFLDDKKVHVYISK